MWEKRHGGVRNWSQGNHKEWGVMELGLGYHEGGTNASKSLQTSSIVVVLKDLTGVVKP